MLSIYSPFCRYKIRPVLETVWEALAKGRIHSPRYRLGVGWWGKGRERGQGQEQLVLSQEKMRLVSLVRDIDTPGKAWGTDCRSSLLGRRISGTIRSAVAITLVSSSVPLLSTLTPSAVCTIQLKPKTRFLELGWSKIGSDVPSFQANAVQSQRVPLSPAISASATWGTSRSRGRKAARLVLD